MIAYLSGIVIGRAGETAIIVTGSGIGYEVRVWTAFPGPQTHVEVYCWATFNESTHEDILFGFSTVHDRELAKLVAETDGIGPGKAHKFVTQAGYECIVRAVHGSSIDELKQKVKGIGPKPMAQILDTLKRKGAFEGTFADPRASAVTLALGALGHQALDLDHQIRTIMEQLPKATPEQIIHALLEGKRKIL
jgi:Holliday junction resolvasome RuvABC DNA-binding subunit